MSEHSVFCSILKQISDDRQLVPQETTPFVTEEKPGWRQQQQRTFGKALGVAEQVATIKAKYITSDWYPFYQVYVHESESAQPIPLLTTTSGVPVVTAEASWFIW